MAPLSPDSTARVYLDYSVAGYDHTLICRHNSTGTIADAVDALQAFITAASPGVYASTLIGLRASNSGSNITFPLSNTFSTSWGSGAAAGNESAQYYDMVGRSVDGRKVRAAIFGATQVSASDKYRVPYSAGSFWSDMIDALGADVNCFVTISAQTPTWHQYANTGINAYWRNKIR